MYLSHSPISTLPTSFISACQINPLSQFRFRFGFYTQNVRWNQAMVSQAWKGRLKLPLNPRQQILNNLGTTMPRLATKVISPPWKSNTNYPRSEIYIQTILIDTMNPESSNPGLTVRRSRLSAASTSRNVLSSPAETSSGITTKRSKSHRNYTNRCCQTRSSWGPVREPRKYRDDQH